MASSFEFLANVDGGKLTDWSNMTDATSLGLLSTVSEKDGLWTLWLSSSYMSTEVMATVLSVNATVLSSTDIVGGGDVSCGETEVECSTSGVDVTASSLS